MVAASVLEFPSRDKPPPALAGSAGDVFVVCGVKIGSRFLIELCDTATPSFKVYTALIPTKAGLSSQASSPFALHWYS